MAKNNGRAFLLKIEDPANAGTYVTVGGCIGTTVAGSSESVDITTKDDAGIRKLGQGYGMKSFSISANGLFDDDAGFNHMQTHFNNDTHANFKVINEDSESWTGLFQITQLQREGADKSAESFSVTLESAGTITKA